MEDTKTAMYWKEMLDELAEEIESIKGKLKDLEEVELVNTNEITNVLTICADLHEKFDALSLSSTVLISHGPSPFGSCMSSGLKKQLKTTELPIRVVRNQYLIKRIRGNPIKSGGEDVLSTRSSAAAEKGTPDMPIVS